MQTDGVLDGRSRWFPALFEERMEVKNTVAQMNIWPRWLRGEAKNTAKLYPLRGCLIA